MNRLGEGGLTFTADTGLVWMIVTLLHQPHASCELCNSGSVCVSPFASAIKFPNCMWRRTARVTLLEGVERFPPPVRKIFKGSGGNTRKDEDMHTYHR